MRHFFRDRSDRIQESASTEPPDYTNVLTFQIIQDFLGK